MRKKKNDKNQRAGLISEWQNAIWLLSPDRYSSLMTELANAKKAETEQSFFDKLFAWNAWKDEEIEDDQPVLYDLVQYEGHTFAHIRMEGVLVKKTSYWAKNYFGMYGTADLLPVIDEIENDPSIHGLLVTFDSPGGTVEGAEVFGKRLYDFSKPSVALVDERAESAGYWFAAQFDKIIATTATAEVGSIGAAMRHVDESQWYLQRGEVITLITNEGSEDKTLGNRYEPLSADAKAYLQGLLNPVYDLFVAQIRKSRRTIADSALNGRSFLAQEALELGLIDQIGTQETALAFLSKKLGNQKSSFIMSNTETPVAQANAQAAQIVPPANDQNALVAQMLTNLSAQMTAIQGELGTLKTDLQATKTANAELETKLAQAEQKAQTAETQAQKAEAQKAEVEQKLNETPEAKAEIPTVDPKAIEGTVFGLAVQKEGLGEVQKRYAEYAAQPWNKRP